MFFINIGRYSTYIDTMEHLGRERRKKKATDSLASVIYQMIEEYIMR
jgi:hypothetical protein